MTRAPMRFATPAGPPAGLMRRGIAAAWAFALRAVALAGAACMLMTGVFLLLPDGSISSAQAAETRLPAEQDARLRSLARELRCLVCQNESLAESHAPLAADLREEIRTQIRMGRADAEIVDYLVARYGEFITYKPPFNARTLALWLGPFAVLLLLFQALWSFHARNRAAARASPATEADAQDVHEAFRRLKRQYGSDDD